ncbi:hypothetical protein NLU13_9619 [Sarocladium strictum]|uniref:ABM domain-containing protein n=1 Tax=Sarocladium strictum TaxID=5046 RepID=A0AA39GAF6_SARSR|nr:hypothetical protein NLU13_9619 [Sarocladium strictum]
MTVTEFALLRLRRDGHGDAELLEALLQCVEIQDQWIDENKPNLRESSESFSSMYLEQNGTEPYLLITAPWDSPAGHREWVQSEENQEAMSDLLGPYLAEDNSLQLFHMDAAGSNRRLLLEDVVPHAPFNVSRLSIDPANKAAVEKEYQSLEEELRGVSSTRLTWAGWMIEQGKDGRESLVVFWDPAARSDKVDAFLSKFQPETRCFRSICSENVCKL